MTRPGKAPGPLICDVKQHALDDGPGIRTVVFFKGCPLRCTWCQNPETQSPRTELKFQPARCIGCEPCTVECPASAFTITARDRLDRSRCTACMDCVPICPAGVFELAGGFMTVEELVAMALSNKVFYDNSGGGITLSGGEPLLHPVFVLDLISRLHAAGIGTVIETCGHVPLTATVRQAIGMADAIYYDVKFADPVEHERQTGVSNTLVLDNLDVLVREGLVKLPCVPLKEAIRQGRPNVPFLVPRVPLVPGATCSGANLSAIASLLASRGVVVVDLLPYNPSWHGKCAALGTPVMHAVDRWLTPAERRAAARCFEGFVLDTFVP